MKCNILHESPNRLRVHLHCARMSLHEADLLEYYLRSVDGVTEVTVYDRTQDAVVKMLAVLMVDFSCALKLSMPIAVLSAMRECSSYHISVKGGRFLEAVAQADTVVFDKTGTLTYAVPTVQDVVPFGGHDAQEMLRLAACLEEHYPHSMATAVVEEAKRRGLSHEEYHSQVQYIVAHGISSMVNGERPSSAAPTSFSRTRAAPSPPGSRRGSMPCPPSTPTSICVWPGSWRR